MSKMQAKLEFGIDKISFYVPGIYLTVQSLAKKHEVDYNKYLTGLGQEKIAILPENEDIITMAANAAYNIITEEDKEAIDFVIFATETAIDQSKSAAIYIHSLLNLKPSCKALEIKQACYSSTAGLRIAINHIKANLSSKVLLVASDNARYQMNSNAEVTQGCGAVAMIISKNPSIASFDDW